MTPRPGYGRAAGLTVVVSILLSVVGAGGLPASAQPTSGGFRTDVPAGWPSAPPATARAYVLSDAVTGQVLAARNADEPLPVASTVKLLTLLTALKTLDLDQTVMVGAEVAIGGAGVGLQPGDTWTVSQLVDAVLVRSGNDAARALAVAAAGSIDAFVGQMRTTAEGLGLDGAVIEDPTGLDDTNRLSARHLAVLARAALADPRLAASAARTSADLPSTGPVGTRNLLLERYPGATGLKTGYTDLSGWSLVGSADRDGRSLVAVVVGARDDAARFDEAAALLDHGFGRFTTAEFPRWRLRRPGGWVDYAPTLPRVSVPIGDPVEVTAVVPAAASDPLGARVESGEAALLEVIAEPTAGVATESSTVDALGARLAQRLYAGMRVAHRLELWPRS